MKKIIYTLSIFLVLSTSCSKNKNAEATLYLENIHNLYNNGEYTEALQKIDSFQTVYPKAFDEIKAGLAFKEEVRIALNKRQIANCDSLLAIYGTKIDSLKQSFIFQKDNEDSEGVFIPKTIAANTITSTMLRTGVNEDGTMYIESVYIGTQLHNKIEIVSKDKLSAQSLPIDDDGFNFRFSNLGKQYEVIKITPIHDNGVTEFIVANTSKPLTVQLKGKNALYYTLTDTQKKAISDSYKLSSWIHKQDSLRSTKDKALTLINYVESKKNGETAVSKE